MVYAELSTCCILAKLTNSNVLGKLAICDLKNWVIQELLLVDLAMKKMKNLILA